MRDRLYHDSDSDSESDSGSGSQSEEGCASAGDDAEGHAASSEWSNESDDVSGCKRAV